MPSFVCKNSNAQQIALQYICSRSTKCTMSVIGQHFKQAVPKSINVSARKFSTTRSQNLLAVAKNNGSRTCGNSYCALTSRKSYMALAQPYSSGNSLISNCLHRQFGTVGCVRGLRTSAQCSAPPLVALLILKPMAKLGAVITGRAFRQWWKALPPNKKDVFLALLRKHKYHILGTIAGLYGISALYYYTHLKATPITNRKRFIAFTESQFRKISEEEAKQMVEKYNGKFVPGEHPVYKIVLDATNRLIRGNQDLHQVTERTWTIYIVDEDVKNAFVLPNGEIFVFTGMLQAVDNTEQLAAVLAHEMAHVVLSHAAELVSFFNFIDFLLIVVLAGLWAFLPNDGLAMVATWFKNRVVQLLLQMPYNRNLESEADEVGLQIAAKGCFDVRESVAFWEGMNVREDDELKDIELLSTHPTHKNRADRLSELMPSAIDLRQSCNCPALPKRDPMISVERLRKRLEDERSSKKNTTHGIIIQGA
ncbi:metalloendopeptidase OMA1, mitochondrial-like [Amphiura filiformis]|uniref:metalloendopeptidase OMA1, mitochondrial-like n=1 Tax=Amphiura filiformis TaxID=82378 RepID=UPI003B21DFBA